jgi:hypothetical protein
MQADHFHPGSSVARPTVAPPIFTTSTLPFGNVRTSSGFEKFIRSAICIVCITHLFF